MSNPGIFLANLGWMTACRASHRSLRRAAKTPDRAQATVLRRILADNASTAFGRAYGFTQISGIADFQKKVPIGRYEDHAPYIDRIRAGEQGVLTAAPVRMFEKTSGSSSPAKYIPYTDPLRAEFQRAVRAWMFDLYSSDPRLLGGRAYWSITPLSRKEEKTGGGIPIGFDHDAEYLGTWERRLAERLFAVPGDLSRIPDVETSLLWTLRFLLQTPDLVLISVWNPSYLLILMERIQLHADQLLQSLESGRPLSAGEGVTATTVSRLKAFPRRAARLRIAIL